MSRMLISRVTLIDGSVVDIAISGNRFELVAPRIEGSFDTVIDGAGLLAAPPFFNTHTHAAMTLLRGIADDLELFEWLNDHIWPAEAKLTAADIRAGSRLAALEMIKSGTVFFNDMYFHPLETIRAAEELGMRAAIGMITLESVPDGGRGFEERNRELRELEAQGAFSDRISLMLAPHALYTVSETALRRIAAESAEHNRIVHIHLAETAREVREFRASHGGKSPIDYLDEIGLLSPRLLIAHAIHLDDREIALLAERGVIFSHMPCSNRKLVSGAFRFRAVEASGALITLGTDGCASNNNLSMFDEMKNCAILAKEEAGDPRVCPAETAFAVATVNGARAFGIDSGVIEAGRLADLVLYALDSPALTPAHHQVSNLVYAADSSAVDTVICDGRILMRGRKVPGETEIIAEARAAAARLGSR